MKKQIESFKENSMAQKIETAETPLDSANSKKQFDESNHEIKMSKSEPKELKNVHPTKKVMVEVDEEKREVRVYLKHAELDIWSLPVKFKY